MDKLSKDEIALRKAKKYIDVLPDYARRFFNKTKLKPSSIHVYSIEIAAFFDYLGTTSIKLNKKSTLLLYLTENIQSNLKICEMLSVEMYLQKVRIFS